ncbi:hypothetical protein NJC10_01215 [Micrococcus sp. M4NT]|uniref:hypothetical protein n=1 Tax=Micrococcus sp. M4NT TaxID=2957501 RepID=UPI0029A2BB51|nr:hypothetical protein [Micrococcus sp. M4NT]MDX2340299.1 hypothetical protein [Micrococcus sp. M4NT]
MDGTHVVRWKIPTVRGDALAPQPLPRRERDVDEAGGGRGVRGRHAVQMSRGVVGEHRRTASAQQGGEDSTAPSVARFGQADVRP